MADISFVSAPIGGGKSLFATRAICEELKRTDRMIITNVPVYLTEDDFPPVPPIPQIGKSGMTIQAQKWPEDKFMTLGQWCHEYVDRPIDVLKRVRVLQQQEVARFYEFLPGFNLPLRTQLFMGEQTMLPDLELRAQMQFNQELPMGAFIVIDEAHMFFGAREWAKVGRGMEFYRSQLRKLNDDLWLVTQHVEKVDKNCRRDATEFLYLKNFSRAKLWGGVTLPGRFKWASYPHQAARNDQPTSEGWLRLEDRQYHKCYNTMAGVGISGLLSPEGSRVKGRHWSVWVAMIFGLMLAAWYVPHWLIAGASKGVSHALSGVHDTTSNMVSRASPVLHSVTNQAGATVPGLKVTGQKTGTTYTPMQATDIETVRWEQDVIIDGISVHGGVVTIYLTDGTSYTSGDGHLTKYENNWATIDNVNYHFLNPAQRAKWEDRQLNKKVQDTIRGVRGR